MIEAEIINTGSELLLGLVQNTHLTWMAGQLAPLGVAITRQVCVPDGPAIRTALAEAFDRADVVFCTGGLGPTADDISREAAAGLLDLPLAFDEEILEIIRARFNRRGLTLTENNRRQAMVPLGACVLPNPFGTAPGLHFPPELLSPYRAKHLFLLPGPPHELHPMLADSVLPVLRAAYPSSEDRECRIYRITGMGESMVENRIGFKVEARGDLTVGYCARPAEVDFRLIGPRHALDETEPEIHAEIGAWVYSYGESLEQTVVNLLRSGRRTLAVAESCTGGTVADRLTDIPGASEVFLAGLVTYANAAKQNLLGVAPEILDKHGAVSSLAALAMAEGARRATGSQLALSTTGIAGPGGGTDTKPVGTVFLALAAEGRPTVVHHLYFPADRTTFKKVASTAALDLLRRHLLSLPLSSGTGTPPRPLPTASSIHEA